MKSVKGGFGVGKVIGTIKRRATAGPSGAGGSDSPGAPGTPQGDTPEAIAARSVKQFVEFTAPSGGDDEDYLYLPAIVEAAESSPGAAAECARLLRKYLARDYATTPSYQYKAIMLMRILTDNPGPTFTRNLDKRFVETVKELLKGGRDASVRTILMETLDTFEAAATADPNMQGLADMWRREKEKAQKLYGVRGLPLVLLNHPANPGWAGQGGPTPLWPAPAPSWGGGVFVPQPIQATVYPAASYPQHPYHPTAFDPRTAAGTPPPAALGVVVLGPLNPSSPPPSDPNQLSGWLTAQLAAAAPGASPPDPYQQNRPQPRTNPGGAPPFDAVAAAQASSAAAHQSASNYFARPHASRRLPAPVELAQRLEEAKTSAKLLAQVVACTPAAEVLNHELMREFADRCASASRSVQAYMVAENPSPDNDTMESLIDVNEQLQRALNMHQRAVLQARKIHGIGSGPPPALSSGAVGGGGVGGVGSGGVTPVNGTSPALAGPFGAPPPGPPPNWGANNNSSGSLNKEPAVINAREKSSPLAWLASKAKISGGGGGGSSRSPSAVASPPAPPPIPPKPDPAEDPFRDPEPRGGQGAGGYTSVYQPPPGPPPNHVSTVVGGEPRLAAEPWHPGGFGGSTTTTTATTAAPPPPPSSAPTTVVSPLETTPPVSFGATPPTTFFGTVGGGGVASAGAPPPGANDRPGMLGGESLYDAEDDDDGYGGGGKKPGQIYRY